MQPPFHFPTCLQLPSHPFYISFHRVPICHLSPFSNFFSLSSLCLSHNCPPFFSLFNHLQSSQLPLLVSTSLLHCHRSVFFSFFFCFFFIWSFFPTCTCQLISSNDDSRLNRDQFSMTLHFSDHLHRLNLSITIIILNRFCSSKTFRERSTFNRRLSDFLIHLWPFPSLES